MKTIEPCVVVIFGASGNLSRRQIDPRAVSPGGGRATAGKNGDTWLQSGAVERRSVDCRGIRYAEVKVFRGCR